KIPSIEKVPSNEFLEPPEGASFAPFMVTGDMALPLKDFTLTSDFGYRNHPITKKLDFHRGIDLAAAEGENVYASFFGEVTDIGENEIYGNFIEISHSGNLKTVYSHCKKIIAKKGMKVKTGDRIATVGSTGISTGPHVHFEVIVKDKYCDPMWVFEDKIYDKNKN
ncbi:MAG: M23 family metallopeptidase, partial [Oscillospiraceae bacterium]